jgi:hypothetical protein
MLDSTEEGKGLSEEEKSACYRSGSLSLTRGDYLETEIKGAVDKGGRQVY